MNNTEKQDRATVLDNEEKERTIKANEAYALSRATMTDEEKIEQACELLNLNLGDRFFFKAGIAWREKNPK